MAGGVIEGQIPGTSFQSTGSPLVKPMTVTERGEAIGTNPNDMAQLLDELKGIKAELRELRRIHCDYMSRMFNEVGAER